MGGWLDTFRQLLPFLNGFDWGHFVAYFILAFTYWRAIEPAGKTTLSVKLLVVILCIVYGITDEFHQSFVPGRMPDAADIRNDAIGALLAMLLLSFPSVERRLRRWSRFRNS